VWRRGALYYGVTGLVDFSPCGAVCKVADANEWILAYRDLLNNSPLTNGPTLYVMGKSIDQPGSEPTDHRHMLQNLDEVPSYVDYLATLGVDAVYAGETMSKEYRVKLVEAAKKHDLPVLGGSINARDTIESGMKFIEHFFPIVRASVDDPNVEITSSPQHDYHMDMSKAPELIKLIVDNGVFFNPTLTSRYGALSDLAASFTQEDEKLLEAGQIYSDIPTEFRPQILRAYQIPKDMDAKELQNRKASFEKLKEFLPQLSAAGGKILIGTDTNDAKLTGLTLHREMKMMADIGIPAYKVLLGATRLPSELLQQDDVVRDHEIT
jgi:hypothetical protein